MAFTKVYWRSQDISGGAHCLLIGAAAAALVAVEVFRRTENQGQYADMIAVSKIVEEGFRVIRAERLWSVPIDSEADPYGSGVIGIASSPVTTVNAHLPAKQATINPNWGAVAYDLLREAGVDPGDVVAVAVSGSFPALNLAVYAALDHIGARPIIIASASASQYGANVPDLLWLDMQRALVEAGVLRSEAVAASLGGREDRGLGLPEQGIEILREAIREAGAELLEPASYEEAVAERIALYRREAGKEVEIAALVNVGGGTATTGPAQTDQFFGSGLIRTAPTRAFAVESVIGFFLENGVPVVNFSGIREIARETGLPYPPARVPAIGSGGIYRARSYSRLFAGAMLVGLLVLIFAVTRTSTLLAMFGRGAKRVRTLEPRV